MSARKAAYFMQRFKREEKLLGPNEQLAIEFVLALLDAQPAEVPEVARRHTNAQALDCADRLNRSFPPTPLKDEAADHIRELVALTLTAAQQGDEHG